MKKVMKVKEILKLLKSEEVKFILPGVTSYRSRNEFDINCPELIELTKDVDEDFYGDLPVVYTFYRFDNIGEDSYALRDRDDSMNLEKFGSSYMWFYTFDILKTKIRSKVRYEDIIFLTYK